MPRLRKNAAMPSGLSYGPEKRSSTRREAGAPASASNELPRLPAKPAEGGEVGAAGVEGGGGAGTVEGVPGGWVSSTGGAVGGGVSRSSCLSPRSRNGKCPSSKYASEVTTIRPAEGTKILYAPGERALRPKLIPTQARGSMVVFEYCDRGLTA